MACNLANFAGTISNRCVSANLQTKEALASDRNCLEPPSERKHLERMENNNYRGVVLSDIGTLRLNDFSGVIAGLEDLQPPVDSTGFCTIDTSIEATFPDTVSGRGDYVPCAEPEEEYHDHFDSEAWTLICDAFFKLEWTWSYHAQMNDFDCASKMAAEESQRRQESVQKPPREPYGTPDQYSLAHVVKPRKKIQLPIDILGSTYATCPDSGSHENIMAKAISDQLDLSIDDAAEHQKEFRMVNGKVVKALGRTLVDCAFTKEPDSQHQCSFYTFKALIAPIIMGMAFLDATETLTKYKHRLPSSMVPRTGPLQIYGIDNPVQRIQYLADLRKVLANADTGSEIDLISLAYARRRGYYLEAVDFGDNRVQLADGSVAFLIGKVNISIIFGDVDSEFYAWEFLHTKIQRTFYVLEGLTSDMVLGEEFLDDTNAFETYRTALTSQESEGIYCHLDTIVWLRTPGKYIRSLLGGNTTAAPEPLSAESADGQEEPASEKARVLGQHRVNAWFKLDRLHRQKDLEAGERRREESQENFEERINDCDARELHRREVDNRRISKLPEGLKAAEKLAELERVSEYEEKKRFLYARHPGRVAYDLADFGGLFEAQATSINSPGTFEPP